MYSVFIDGREGTTGLQLSKRLEGRRDVEIIPIAEELRKDENERAKRMNQADLVFLCLPDAAARAAVGLVTNPRTRIIDASTAHRTQPGWAYGFGELSPAHKAAIKSGARIANPGCYATGFIAIAYPLVKMGLIDPGEQLFCHAVSGYSGAGKQGIAQYEAADRAPALASPRLYALGLAHKHLPEMQAVSGLARPPVFNPQVCDFYSGMSVSVPLWAGMLKKRTSPAALKDALCGFFRDQRLIQVMEAPEDGFLPANLLSGTCRMNLYVCGNERQMTLVALLDNLGKGASGAAVQNMNLALGLDEYESLLQGEAF
jgi:N-acetyl-gamma-glutamyl-phosphate reductase